MSEFKFSERTKIILKNFSQIQPCIVFAPGHELRTISPSSDEILGVAKITEEIPRQFGIYDLEHLLKVISTLNHPILTPYEHHLEFKNERGDRLEFDSVWDPYKYPYCPVAQIKQPPEDLLSNKSSRGLSFLILNYNLS
jgi:hypothetical protein